MEMKNVAVIGGGISGLSISHCLKKNYQVKVFERDSQPGGLIKCERVNGNLYHKVGGHVFNSRRQDVLEWFWNFFDQGNEFTKAIRNSVISMPNNQRILYPIEDHLYMMDEPLVRAVIHDIFEIVKNGSEKASLNFEEFLINRFGRTLYDLYFKPYNEKIWKSNLKKIPLSWLEGKLPMPTPEDIIYNNLNHVKEMDMVHSSFYYPKKDGSQFLADRLSKGLNIAYNSNIDEIVWDDFCWHINDESYDRVVFCGNIKELPLIIKNVDIENYSGSLESLEYHGTTSVFCKIDKNDYSWIYLPDKEYPAHRIICTGNFAASNNESDMITTATLEFTDHVSKEDIDRCLMRVPFSPQYIAHKYTQYTYPVQNTDTRDIVNNLKQKLEKKDFYLLGRFAEWEYYNMDAAMGAAIDLSKKLKTNDR